MNKDLERPESILGMDTYLLRLLCDATATQGAEKSDSAVQVDSHIY